MKVEELRTLTDAVIDALMDTVEGCTMTPDMVRALIGLAYTRGRNDLLNELIDRNKVPDHAQP